MKIRSFSEVYKNITVGGGKKNSSIEESGKSRFLECGFWGFQKKIARCSNTKKTTYKKIFTLLTTREEIVKAKFPFTIFRKERANKFGVSFGVHIPVILPYCNNVNRKS